jgi:hypothetical protein
MSKTCPKPIKMFYSQAPLPSHYLEVRMTIIFRIYYIQTFTTVASSAAIGEQDFKLSPLSLKKSPSWKTIS